MGKTKALLFGLGLLWVTGVFGQATETNLIKKLQLVEDNVADERQRKLASHKIMSMMIVCEFEENCLLEMIPKLQMLYQEDPNIIYKGFLTYLRWAQSDLKFNAEHCALEEKKAIKKIYAQCYQIWIENREKGTLTFSEKDKAEVELQSCLREKTHELAKEGNIFAQAVIVNVSAFFGDSKALNIWSKKMEARKDTPTFNTYMKCAELP